VYLAAKRAELSAALANALLAGEWDRAAAVARVEEMLPARPRWLGAVVGEVFDAYHRAPADRPRELAAFIGLALERRRSVAPPPAIRKWFLPESAMGRMVWPTPAIPDLRVLSEFLGTEPAALLWLADVRSLERTAPDQRLRNYVYTTRQRRSGLVRVIETPKPRLKAAQRRVLHDLLDWIPAHRAAHGFTRGRSALTHASAHAGRHAVMRLDLEDFFASISAGRVYGIFRSAGYPEAVAHTMTGLATNVMPADVWQAIAPPAGSQRSAAHHRLGRRLATPHLPQGAPTSPALANLAAFSLDHRLAGLAASLGFTYTRYADDLTFSGSAALVRNAGRLRATIKTVAAQEGFKVNDSKTTLATRAGRQTVCGLVVNEHANVARDEYDTLKAILHNAARDGPESQNRAGLPDFRAHLLGRISWVESAQPSRGAKLRDRYAQITWDT
jgi:hypothetical protein